MIRDDDGIKNYCIEIPLNGINIVTKFDEILPSGSKVISGGQTDRLVI
jgi:hypothetical protein